MRIEEKKEEKKKEKRRKCVSQTAPTVGGQDFFYSKFNQFGIFFFFKSVNRDPDLAKSAIFTDPLNF